MTLHSPDEPVYTIGVVARLLNISPQTLRQFEREGLIEPSRTENNMRLYSQNELVALQRICQLIRDEGVNIAGVRAVLRIERRYGVITTGYHATIHVGRPAPERAGQPSEGNAGPDGQGEPSRKTRSDETAHRPERDGDGACSGGSAGLISLLAVAAALGLGVRWL